MSDSEINPFMSLMCGLFLSNILFSIFSIFSNEKFPEKLTFYKSIVNKYTLGILTGIYYNPKLIEYIPNIVIGACLSSFLQ
jgi:hypothetical protein